VKWLVVLLQKRSDESAFLGQKRIRAEEERIVPGTFLVAVGGENCCVHCECARRLTSVTAGSLIVDCSPQCF
jgi:hypothetical protein